jgi:hypothetical protein
MAESLRDVRPTWVAFGWFIGFALAAAGVLALTAADMMRPETDAENFWITVSLALGFGLAGFIVGVRVRAAPLLHGLGMGLFSLVVWLFLNLFIGEPMGDTAWQSMSLRSGIMLMVLHTAAAMVGVRMGVRWTGA